VENEPSVTFQDDRQATGGARYRESVQLKRFFILKPEQTKKNELIVNIGTHGQTTPITRLSILFNLKAGAGNGDV